MVLPFRGVETPLSSRTRTLGGTGTDVGEVERKVDIGNIILPLPFIRAEW